MNSPIKIWRRQKHIPELLDKRGRIISWTIIRTPPTGFKQYAPYVVALIKLDNGKKITGQIVGIYSVGDELFNSQIKTGKRVKAVLRKIREPDGEGIIEYGIKFMIEDGDQKTENQKYK